MGIQTSIMNTEKSSATKNPRRGCDEKTSTGRENVPTDSEKTTGMAAA